MIQPRLSKNAEKFISKLPSKQAGQIIERLMILAANPNPTNSRHMKNCPNYKRIKSGEYRIIYSLENNNLNIPHIGKRNDDEIYKNFFYWWNF